MTQLGQKIKAPKAPCPICGKMMTKPGLVGHMAWKHGKDVKRPLLPSTTMPRLEEQRKAQLWEKCSPVQQHVALMMDALKHLDQGYSYMVEHKDGKLSYWKVSPAETALLREQAGKPNAVTWDISRAERTPGAAAVSGRPGRPGRRAPRRKAGTPVR